MLAVLLFNPMTTKHRKSSVSRQSKLLSDAVKPSEDVWCRTCLNTDDLLPLFSNKESERKRSQELRLATGLKITMNDGLSQKICIKCLDMLKVSLKFRRLSKCAEKSLRDLVQNTDSVKTEPNPQKKLLFVDEQSSDDPVKDDNTDIDNDEFQTDVHDDSFQTERFPDSEIKVSIKHEDVTFESPPGEKKTPEPQTHSPYICPICKKEFLMKPTYKAHVRFHTNFCVCESCGKRCRNNNQLEEHKRARHGLGRIHKCAYCEYSSATKEALTVSRGTQYVSMFT
ncbi:hypothetical protein ACJJTC_002651 [Scirpophaga incertulas]